MIDLGPGAGRHGGQLSLRRIARALSLAFGPPQATCSRRRSSAGFPAARVRAPTAAFRAGPRRAVSASRGSDHGRRGPRAQPSAISRVRIPLGPDSSRSPASPAPASRRSCATSFTTPTPAASRERSRSTSAPTRESTGSRTSSDILMVDQSPLGRSARSNPVTYVKAWDEIRQVFASTARAVSRGLTARDFSFNAIGGRCEACKGTGLADDRHAVSRRRDGSLRRVRRPSLSESRARRAPPRQVHRRHSRDDRLRRPRLLRRRSQDRAASSSRSSTSAWAT